MSKRRPTKPIAVRPIVSRDTKTPVMYGPSPHHWNTPDLAAERERVRVLRGASSALIADIQRRYPGEPLRCPYMQALADALAATEPTP